jgi:hypothetical protein
MVIKPYKHARDKVQKNHFIGDVLYNQNDIILRHIPQIKHPKIKIYPLVHSIARIDS